MEIQEPNDRTASSLRFKLIFSELLDSSTCKIR